MKLKTIAYAAFIAVAAGAFVIGSGGRSEAKGKKKMAAPPPDPGPCFDDRRAGLRRQGRHEVHLR